MLSRTSLAMSPYVRLEMRCQYCWLTRMSPGPSPSMIVDDTPLHDLMSSTCERIDWRTTWGVCTDWFGYSDFVRTAWLTFSSYSPARKPSLLAKPTSWDSRTSWVGCM